MWTLRLQEYYAVILTNYSNIFLKNEKKAVTYYDYESCNLEEEEMSGVFFKIFSLTFNIFILFMCYYTVMQTFFGLSC